LGDNNRKITNECYQQVFYQRNGYQNEQLERV